MLHTQRFPRDFLHGGIELLEEEEEKKGRKHVQHQASKCSVYLSILYTKEKSILNQIRRDEATITFPSICFFFSHSVDFPFNYILSKIPREQTNIPPPPPLSPTSAILKTT